ncbi:hypothetical protein OG462_44875 [Streptomyces sp. NBC_01077]|uniref:hypothetical protein n=1 Tax=Streptomyces sp. NBC_01077 TaxID=2903746 RepID=UPI00386E43A0|nr:hypothetical protein OG462_00125 [Streptomyces sp. NBC_01077]WSV43809.1 hypothetical protein OG462_44875 [Streptomyces sp. NBC_01077]
MPGTTDLRTIHQPWLRDLLRHWLTTSSPRTDNYSNTMRALAIASRALAQRPGEGLDPAALGFTDASAVVDAFRTALRRDGTAYRSSQRRTLLACFFQLIDYGRRSEHLNTLAGPFSRDPVQHRIRLEGRGRHRQSPPRVGHPPARHPPGHPWHRRGPGPPRH